jgi:hypothetical protein
MSKSLDSTLGAPFAMLPAPGLYWSQKAAFASAQLVNGQGNDTGIHANTCLTTSMFLLSTNYHILGARYGAFVYNVGIYHANIHEANNSTGNVTSAADIEIDPIDLSWNLGKGLFFGISEGFNPPTGSFDPSRLINIGHDLEIPKGQTPANRKDIELLFDGLPEPIDLELDLTNRMMYWTDRGDPPRGNTVNRAPMDAPEGKRQDPEIVFTHLMEGIGLALDLKGGRMFITDFGGSVYRADLDRSNSKTLLFYQGNLTGIAYAELPTT